MRFLITIILATLSWVANGQKKILFVGNSLTYYNNLPELVVNIARQDGSKIIATGFLKPDYSLEDHWNEGLAIGELKNNQYDLVILQQGPSALRASRENLVQYALKFAEVCKTRNSRLAFYMVWPSADRALDFQNVIKSYKLAADTTGSKLLPVGQAWLEAWKLEKNFPLYAGDQFHPSELGSLLGALVIYGSLFEKKNLDFVSLEKLHLKSITEQQLLILKRATSSVLSNR